MYGQWLMVVYLVTAAVLLANLLIAIISYKYRPDEVQAQATFKLAEIVDQHQFQVGRAGEGAVQGMEITSSCSATIGLARAKVPLQYINPVLLATWL